MKTCEKYKNLIEKYVEGTIGDGQLAELKTHMKTCESCSQEFERCILLQDVVRQAFSSPMTAEQARASLVARLFEEPNLRLRPASIRTTLFAGRQAAVAAGVLLALGLFLGFVLGRAGTGKPTAAPLTAQVPILIGDLEGTILVRHEGSDVWQTLEVGSNIYLGDTFHSTAKSAFALKLDDKSTLELNQNSMLVLKLYNGQTQFFLEHGECTAGLESPHGPFFISTPNGRMEALGTEFTVKVTDE
jgi:ferric-dicitrate binding protein FerR (iron transport regulator)